MNFGTFEQRQNHETQNILKEIHNVMVEIRDHLRAVNTPIYMFEHKAPVLPSADLPQRSSQRPKETVLVTPEDHKEIEEIRSAVKKKNRKSRRLPDE